MTLFFRSMVVVSALCCACAADMHDGEDVDSKSDDTDRVAEEPTEAEIQAAIAVDRMRVLGGLLPRRTQHAARFLPALDWRKNTGATNIPSGRG